MEIRKAKLIMPLFYGVNFNRDGKRMRAIFDREVSNGEVTYKIWHKVGQYDHYYPCADNDKYLLYVENNEYLIPLKMTDYFLIDRCGYPQAVKELYGNEKERIRQYRDLQEKGDNYVLCSLKKERDMIFKYGNNPSLQANYIKSILDEHIELYVKAKENGGETFPDFIGAAMLGELDICDKLSRHYKETRENEREIRVAAIREEEQKEIMDKNKIANDRVQQAIQIIRNGGSVKNDEITFFDNCGIGKTYHIINYLMRRYSVEIPLRTQGWINTRLIEVTVKDSGCSVRFYKTKKGKCSQKFFEYMDMLIKKIQNGDE